MNDYRRSLLQIRILIKLDENSARSIIELAESLNAQRPSVSRSMQTLKVQGLVSRNRQGWHLTETGKIEAISAKEKLREITSKFTNAITGVARTMKEIAPAFNVVPAYPEFRQMAIFPEILKSSLLIADSQMAGIVKQMNEAIKLSPSFNALNQQIVSQAITTIVTPFMGANFYKKAIKPLLEIQLHNSEIFQNIIAQEISPMIEGLANQNNLFMTKMINDILAIRHQEIAKLVENVRMSDFAWLAKDLSNVNQAYFQLFAEQVNTLKISPSFIHSSGVTEVIALPTATVSHYVDSARNLIEAELTSDVPEFQEKGYEAVGDENLDPLLYQLNPEFVDMRQGSWVALNTSSPDHLRQAATSQRELIRQLLEVYVPNTLLPKDSRQGPQLKTRLRIALKTSESDTDFIEAILTALMSYYNQLNKYTHHNEKHEESLRAILQTGEGLIRFILTLAGRKTGI